MKMTRKSLWIVVALAAVWSLPRWALADDASDLNARLKAAAASAKSFELDTISSNGLTMVTTVVLPSLAHVHMEYLTNTIDSYTDGTKSYTRVNGGGWVIVTVPPEQAKAMVAPLMQARDNLKILPDTTIEKVNYGAFSFEAPSMMIGGQPTPAMHMSCVYDKATFLVATCTGTGVQLPGPLKSTYTKWNDPSNVVVLPVIPTPLPTASPPPSAAAPAFSPAPVAPKPQPSAT